MTTLVPKFDVKDGALVPAGAINRSYFDKLLDVISVKDFGAKGDGTTDDAAAINAAYAALISGSASGSGSLYFPTGTYKINSKLDFTLGNATTTLNIYGDGNSASVIVPNFVSGNAIEVIDTPVFNMMDMGVSQLSISRDASSFLVYVSDCVIASINNIAANCFLGGLFSINSTTFLTMSNCQGDSNDGTGGNNCLYFAGTSGAHISNCQFRVGPFGTGGYTNSKPCVLIEGQSTSINITNSNFVGGGPLSVFNISGITSTSTTFTLTTSVNHNFQAGDFLVIRNSDVATYNSTWRITSVTLNTITVTTALNPGTATAVGTAESQSACVLVTNAKGAVNESRISNCLFESGQQYAYGRVGLYIDGRKGVAPIQGWTITGCYADYGSTGILLSGQASFAASQTTVFGFTIGDCVLQGLNRGLQLDQCAGVAVSNCIGGEYLFTQADNLGYPDYNEAILIYSAPTAPFTQGISITNCVMGMGRGFSGVNYGYSHGILLDGNTVQSLTITGNTLYGARFAIADTFDLYGVGYPTNSIWQIQNNLLENGAWPVTTASQIILDCTRTATGGGTLNCPPYNDVSRVAGIADFTFINPGGIGEQRTLIFDSACTIKTGGNIAITANYNVLIGQSVNIFFDGTAWYIK